MLTRGTSTKHLLTDGSTSARVALGTFGLDVTHDLLRAVTGTPRDDTLGHRLTGADALAISTRVQLPELPALAKRLLAAYRSDAYRENFGFIDYLRPETKPGRIADLNQLLVEALNSREIDDLHLAAPEPVDWMYIRGFRFSSEDGNEVESDPKISKYLASRQNDELSLDDLKVDQLLALRAEDDAVAEHGALSGDRLRSRGRDELYVLSGGRWFRVNTDFKELFSVMSPSCRRTPACPRQNPGSAKLTTTRPRRRRWRCLSRPEVRL